MSIKSGTSLCGILILQFNTRVGSTDVLKKRWRILADDGLGMIATNVMPFDTILVNVVQNPKARFFGLVDFEFSIVGLCPLEVASSAPWLVTPTSRCFISFGQLDTRARPEPAVD